MEPEIEFAIIKLCFMGATFPRILGEGLVWVNASCVDRADTWTLSLV